MLEATVTESNTGVAKSMVKLERVSIEEIFPAVSVTLIVQLLYVPSASVLSVIVLFPLTAEVVVEAQLPPYVIVHASVELKV